MGVGVRECLPLLLPGLCPWDLFRLHMEFLCSRVFQGERPGLRIVKSVTQDFGAWVNQKSVGLQQLGRFPEGGSKIEDQRQGRGLQRASRVKKHLVGSLLTSGHAFS